MNYRREIDGLRALAVLPVILFHAGVERFSGGFVGVDIFFVISGYLITSIILAELEQGRFSLLNFYERRARRILPALFLVMLVSIFFAWLWLFPSDLRDFAKSLIAVPLFVSNFLFLHESGYFETEAELKPLLHTWSLAVEEQYYVLFPLLLIFCWRFGKQNLLIILAVIFVASLVLAQWSLALHPSAAFFLLPARAWELLVGAFAAFYLVNPHRFVFNRRVSEFGACLGLAFIVCAIFTYSKATPFPGVYALVPTLGAVLIIVFATQATTVGRFVGNPLFVGIGLLSYSAYLWHQPLFAFARHTSAGEPSEWLFAGLIALTFLLAYMTWRFIEAPFRSKTTYSRRQIFMFAALGSFIFIGLGCYGVVKKGFYHRLTESQKEVLTFRPFTFREIYKQGTCFLKPEQSYVDFKSECQPVTSEPRLLLWGDSHAAALAFGLRENFPHLTQYTASLCPPLIGMDASAKPRCAGVNQFVSEAIKKHQYQTIVLHANWLFATDSASLLGLKNTFEFIRQYSPQSNIILVGGVPQYKPNLPTYILRKRQTVQDNLWLELRTYDDVTRMDADILAIAKPYGVHFFSSVQSFCDKKMCLATHRYADKLMPMAWDYGHLTSAGSVFLGAKFKVFYDAIP